MIADYTGKYIANGCFNCVSEHVSDPALVIMTGDRDIFKLEIMMILDLVVDFEIRDRDMSVIVKRMLNERDWSSAQRNTIVNLNSDISSAKYSNRLSKSDAILELATNPDIVKSAPKLSEVCTYIYNADCVSSIGFDNHNGNWLINPANGDLLPHDVFCGDYNLQKDGTSTSKKCECLPNSTAKAA